MNEALLRKLLGDAGAGLTLSPEGVDAVLAYLNHTMPKAKKLASSRSERDRVHALALVTLAALHLLDTVPDATRHRLAKRLEVLAGAPRSELLEKLAEIVAELLAAWPNVSDPLLSRLETALAAPEHTDTPPTDGTGAPPASPPASNSGSEKEDTMAFELEIDDRGLPPRLEDEKARAAYKTTVGDKLKVANGGNVPTDEALAYTVGKLLRTGQFDETSSSFASFVRQAWNDLTTEYAARVGKVSGLDVVKKIVEILGKPNGMPAAKPWSAQQLAFIYDRALETLTSIAPADSGFATRVERAYLDYASGDVGFDGFELPDLDGTTDGDLLPQNMLSAGRLYGAYEFERLKLIPVVDRIVELWRAGVVAIANDSGGQLLNEYYWARLDRLAEGARGMIFGRLFGAEGVEASKDAQPNKPFEMLLRRFLTNVALLKRLQEQQNVIANPGESRTLASENVRKTGRELGTNLSLYGWGSAYFDAAKIESHIAAAAKVASDPQVQRAFAATTLSQVIERVAQQEFGVTPNIVKHDTMARSGRRVIEILAQNPQALTDRSREFQNVLGDDLWNDLARQALAWLSVNGTTSEQLVTQAKPVDAIASPTVPQMPAQPASPDITRLKDMVASGKMPSLNDLQRMFN